MFSSKAFIHFYLTYFPPSNYWFIHILPSSCLVNAFGDEVCRESVLKLLPVFKGVVHLCIRHAAALEPAVKHLRDSPQRALPRPGWDCETVYAG